MICLRRTSLHSAGTVGFALEEWPRCSSVRLLNMRRAGHRAPPYSSRTPCSCTLATSCRVPRHSIAVAGCEAFHASHILPENVHGLWLMYAGFTASSLRLTQEARIELLRASMHGLRGPQYALANHAFPNADFPQTVHFAPAGLHSSFLSSG